MTPQITPRGALYTLRLGDLLFRYLTGRDADAATPVYDMSIGELTVTNVGERPVNLQYNSDQTFYAGHTFTFGPNALEQQAHAQPEHSHSHSPSTADESYISIDLAPGETIPMSRQDLLAAVERIGPASLEDGTICTRFQAGVLIDQHSEGVSFGPHCFRVDPARDWAEEEDRYVEFFLARDRAALEGRK